MRFKSLALCAAISTLFGATAHAQISDNAVRIGVLTDLSGLYSDLSGPGSVVATQMAIDDFIAKEKPNFKIEMLTADHQNKADIASNKAREWIERDKVDVLSELVGTAVGLAVQKLAKDMNKVTLQTATASSRLTNEDCSDVSIHWTYDTYALAAGTGRAMVKQGRKSWYFITADYAFGHSLEKDTSDIVKAAGGTVTGSVRHPFPGNDFSSYLLRAQSSGAQVIGLANAGGDLINTIKQASEFGISQKQSLAALLMFISDVHSLGLNYTQNMYLTEAFYWDLNDETRAWSKRFFEKHKRMPTMIHAGQYSAIYHYLKAVKATGSDDTQKVMAQMRKTPVNDFFAKNGTIREDGRMVHDVYLLQVKKPSESKGPWDYYHVRATIPGADAFQPLSASRCPLIKKS